MINAVELAEILFKQVDAEAKSPRSSMATRATLGEIARGAAVLFDTHSADFDPELFFSLCGLDKKGNWSW